MVRDLDIKLGFNDSGPKGETIADMWQMVWQTNSNRIVMVTNKVEGGKVRNELYTTKIIC